MTSNGLKEVDDEPRGAWFYVRTISVRMFVLALIITVTSDLTSRFQSAATEKLEHYIKGAYSPRLQPGWLFPIIDNNQSCDSLDNSYVSANVRENLINPLSLLLLDTYQYKIRRGSQNLYDQSSYVELIQMLMFDYLTLNLKYKIRLEQQHLNNPLIIKMECSISEIARRGGFK